MKEARRIELIRLVTMLAKHGGSKKLTAEVLNMPRTTFRNAIAEAEAAGIRVKTQAKAAEPADPEKRGLVNGVPMSEDERKFRPDWTAEDCINELIRIAKIDTRKVVTRNYFRVHSEISESTWNRFFGTFLEFKRQAEIILSRHAHRLERDIAKHASVDKMRALNTDKREFEGKYLRPSNRAFQVTIAVSDLHGKHCDPFFRRVFLDLLRRIRPDKVVLDGDIVDLAEFSKHSKDPRAFDVKGEIDWLHALLSDIRTVLPDVEILYVEGNHEFRLLRHMGEQTPAMMVMLSDLHGFTVPKLLGLDRFEVNYIARADMTAWTERAIKTELRKNYVTLFDSSLLFGHFPEMRSMGIPGASGHHHKHIVWPAYSPVYGPYEWHQIGCGHMREASYCNGERWANGLLISYTHVASKRTQFDYVDLSHQAAMVGGLFYERRESEPVLDLSR